MNEYNKKCKEEYLKYVDVFFNEKCKKCEICDGKKGCKIAMLMDGTSTIFAVPSCVCNDEEFKELMINEY